MKISTQHITTTQFTLFAIFFALSLTACSRVQTTKQPIHIHNAGKVVFSNIITNKSTNGLKVSGNVRQNAQLGKQITIPGHIHISLKTSNDKELEVVNARTHRKYGNSKLWHFDGVLKTKPSTDNKITVEYHNKHFK